MCPHCFGVPSKVVETRHHNFSIWRRRRCETPDCGLSFITKEISSASMTFPRDVRAARIDRIKNWKTEQKELKHPKSTVSLDVFSAFKVQPEKVE
jgi:hypothetical protein